MQNSVYSLVLGLFGVPKAVGLAVDQTGSLEVLHQALVFLED